MVANDQWRIVSGKWRATIGSKRKDTDRKAFQHWKTLSNLIVIFEIVLRFRIKTVAKNVRKNSFRTSESEVRIEAKSRKNPKLGEFTSHFKVQHCRHWSDCIPLISIRNGRPLMAINLSSSAARCSRRLIGMH